MNKETLKAQIRSLISNSSGQRENSRAVQELRQGTLGLLAAAHGSNGVQLQAFNKEVDVINKKWFGEAAIGYMHDLAVGTLQNLNSELDAGLVGSLERTIIGVVISDFVLLARQALGENNSSDAKNVAAVLAAAAYEDTLRRLAAANGIPHIEKLAELLTALKDNGLLQGSQVGIANSYLNFRNSALHAQWDRVERESVASVLGFVEQLLLKHF